MLSRAETSRLARPFSPEPEPVFEDEPKPQLSPNGMPPQGSLSLDDWHRESKFLCNFCGKAVKAPGLTSGFIVWGGY